ncbi:MAG: TolC family protein [Gemmatimonadetes bacterium]|nr:TolC family protein [Gemmatimonadota bacterium]
MVDRNGRTRFERWTPLGGAALLLVGLAVTPRLAAQERTVTLDEAIALALRAQPTIIQAQGDLDVAYAGKREAFGSYLPTLSASSSLSQNSSNRWNAATQQFLSQPRSVSYSTGLNASLVIFDGFSRLAESQAAGATVASADATLTNQRFQVILQTKQAFFNALAAAELVKVTQTQVARAEQQLKISKDKLAAGSAIRSDTLRSTVELGNARLQLLNAQAQLATAEANLARLIGADGGVHAGGAPVMPDLAALDTAALRQEVVSRSPSVQAAQAQARAAGAQVGVSRAQYLPTVTANYSQSWAGARDSAGLAPSSFTNWPQLGNSWSLRFSLSWPLFNGFTRETAMSRSLASRNAAEARAADARRQANANITQQLAVLEAAAQQMAIAEASRAAAEEDLRVQQERYRLGAATIVDVLTSQVSLGQAEVSLVQARLNVLIAKAQIEALAGREL